MLTVGRGADYKKEQAANAQKLFAQETSRSTALRHSDWTCTLVLMVLDLHTIAAHANPTGAPWVAKEWGAFMQTGSSARAPSGASSATSAAATRRGDWPSVGNALGWWGIVGRRRRRTSSALGIWLFTTLNVTASTRGSPQTATTRRRS